MMTATTIVGLLLVLWSLVFGCIEGSSEPWLKSEKFAQLGTQVQLPCVLKWPQCEGLHSVKWYRGTMRIFTFSEDTGVTRENNDIAARSDIEYSVNSTKTYLKIPEVKPEDEGLYKCEATYLANNSECNNVQHVILNVTDKPVVEVVTDPGIPVNEADRLNVSLSCQIISGNPPALTAVRWYLNGDLLKELPDCSRNNSLSSATAEDTLTFCVIDPSKFLPEAVGLSFYGNYSCEGKNGWGPMSPAHRLQFIVVKKGPLAITCFVLDPGRPHVSGFKWFRGLHKLPEETEATLRIESVNLETETNFE